MADTEEGAGGDGREIAPLVQRVDALLKRHQEQLAAQRSHADAAPAPAMTASAMSAPAPAHVAAPAAAVPAPVMEEDFPLLTEVVDGAIVAPDPILIPQAMIAMPAPAPDPEVLAAAVQAAVFERVMPEVERVLDQRLARQVTDLLEQVLHGLRAELTVGVRQMVREAVSVAVARELASRGLQENDASPDGATHPAQGRTARH